MRRQRSPRQHFYKGFEIRNIKKAAHLKRPAFHIITDGDFSVTATPTLRSARNLIDIWNESRFCACGELHMAHDHRCKVCADKGLIHVSQLLRPTKRPS